MPLSNPEDFIQRLQVEVLFQSQLEHRKLLPEKLGGLGRFIASYPWQVILVISGVTALVKALMRL
ncbi:hypothetical protein KJ654_02475 [Patescibacteria group bacterium]|nr:hypothetical protein [Patescibacteria group bacterium]MBU1967020.1 hypothetical protein [Patescibacteria group bacterium]